jgi:hypothetical protein
MFLDISSYSDASPRCGVNKSNCLFVMEDYETILPYDAMSSRIDAYDPKVFEYIGKGVVCCVNGTPQNFSLDNPEHVSYFFRRK